MSAAFARVIAAEDALTAVARQGLYRTAAALLAARELDAAIAAWRAGFSRTPGLDAVREWKAGR